MTHPASTADFDFARDVLQASHRAPVLVDYWAPWCGPCRVLGPVLERLAAEADGRWTLVQINTDEHPDLALQAGIRGIPAVKLYADGAVVGEFTGALPEPMVRRWLEEHLPSPARRALAAAKALLEAGERDAARPLLEEAVAADPSLEEARARLAALVAFEDPARAEALTEGLAHLPEYEAVRTLRRFLALPDDPSGLPEAPVRADYLAAAGALRAGDADTALERLIAVLQRDRAFDDDGARRAAVAIFILRGETDPVVRKHRPTFNRSLY